MTTTTPTDLRGKTQSARWARLASAAQRQGALIALALLVLFGALRYDGFFGSYNIFEMLRNDSMIGLIALGMTFVIMTGGIDLSVGSVAALASVLAARMSPYGPLPAIALPVLVGALVGLLNGWVIARLNILPFIATLAMLLAARGLALILANNASIGVDAGSGFIELGRDLFGLPIPLLLLLAAYAVGVGVLGYTRFGRHVLSVGGNEEAARLMGLPVDRIKLAVYALSGALAGLAGVILAALTFTGLPTAGSGWELSAIAAVVVGGTLLTGGMGSVATTLVGVLLLELIFNILNFENGRGLISLSAYWQSVIRGVFLLVVVVLQNRLARRRE
ncbi:MAG TPA: ABC transporter permease [Kouleothrix sp.]|nr:ABC transporter permease [Kouleothrix sp.]HRC76704.1 ABC transporter permease [Kouleothrix sp.]